MSLFGRALAGAGSGAAAMANRYIDEEMQANRARMLADLQFDGAKRLDEYNLGDERQAKLTAAEAARERAVGGARNETALAGKVAEAGSQPLRQAKIDSENEVTRGTVGAKADAQSVMDRAKNATDLERAAAMLPLEVKKAYAVADAQGRASAKNREAPGADLKAKLAITEQYLGRPLTEPEKLGLLGLAKGRDPELDTVTVKDVRTDDKGNTTETTRKEVRRPGAEAPKVPEAQRHAEAQAAVKQGAPIEEVNRRLVEAGYTPLPGTKKAGGIMEHAAAPEAPLGSPIERMDDRTLKRIAAIQGHASQREAQAELERRARMRPEIDTSGPGFGNIGG